MTTTFTQEIQPPIMYGVWIPGEGWLKSNKDVFSDYNVEKALEVARCIGRGATVRFIDEAIIDFEQQYLAQEKIKWRIFKNLFGRNDNRQASSR